MIGNASFPINKYEKVTIPLDNIINLTIDERGPLYWLVVIILSFIVLMICRVLIHNIFYS